MTTQKKKLKFGCFGSLADQRRTFEQNQIPEEYRVMIKPSLGRIGKVEIHSSITEERVLEAAEEGTFGLGCPGFCIVCGTDVEGVEPDARRYPCEACGAPHGVYGAQEVLLHI